MIIVGTAYYTSRHAAGFRRGPYSKFPNERTQQLLDEGRILIGRPPYNPDKGEWLMKVDDGKRWGICRPEPKKA